MILTKLFVILITILLILEMITYFKNWANPPMREGAATMQSGSSTMQSAGGAYADPGLGKDPVYLSTLNASNISYLKDKVDELVGLKQQLNDVSAKVEQNTTALTQLSTQISDNTNKALGRDPASTAPIPQASGLN